MNGIVDPVFADAWALALGAVLAGGAVLKLRDPGAFRAALQDYRILPAWLEAPFALGFPLLEGAAGVLLLLPASGRPGGAVLAMGVLALATAGVLVNLLRGRVRIDCGCGGARFLPLSWPLVLRNAILIALAWASTLPVQARPGTWLDPLSVGFGALFLLGLYAIGNQLLINQSRLASGRTFS